MTDKATFRLPDKKLGHSLVCKGWEWAKTQIELGKVMLVEFKQETRSDAQNRRLWSMLSDLSRQVEWHGEKLTAEEWKDVLTACLKKQKSVPGIDGGFVVLGARTSKMTKAEMVELQDLIEAFGAQQGVIFKVWQE